ncbi:MULTISPECIES: hypothetical protein [Pseudofrankia]|uniref:hypothetical protein n=1 Tax=Pseudofrankia TaxID=2994363 RepID=UPI000234B4D1|nr:MULTISPECIES: hypothetical protein [Pseudofrankia]OHV30407.1 hypothetical protein BCD49_33695 [Pseudofrankia sp. EUN1h]
MPSSPTAPGRRPLVLLPVRLETRYSADGTRLRVRVYPDDVHVDQLDRPLDQAEEDAGADYWRKLWRGVPVAEARAGLRGAVRPDRASWVATAMTPANPFARPHPPAPTPEPLFLVAAGIPSSPPVARGLPDRFTGRLFQAGELVATGEGGPVRRPLVLGPSRGGALTAAAGLTVGAGAEWVVDFDAAVAAGMAFTIPLGGHTGPFRLLVYGVRDGDGTTELTELLTAHRHTGGVELLAPGTPTNNTERDRSAWHRRTVPTPPDGTQAPPEPDADGPLLAAALGIGADALAGVDGADQTDQRLASAAHVALWPGTWDTYLDALVQATPTGLTMGEATRAQLRATFEEVVRGRGPLPALRIGRQPYGVLPVVDTGGPTPVAGPMPRLEPTLARARGLLLAGSDAPTAASSLLDVLGTAPTMIGTRMRAGLPDLDALLDALTFYDPLGDDRPKYNNEVVMRDILAKDFGLDFGRLGYISFGSLTRPLLLPLVADGDAVDTGADGDDRYGDREFVRRMLAGEHRTISTVLQALLEMSLEAQRRHQRFATGGDQPLSAAGVDAILGFRIDQLLAGRDPTLGTAVRQALASPSPDALRRAAAALGDSFGPADASTLASYQPLAGLRTSLLQVADARESETLLGKALGVSFLVGYDQSRFAQAAQELADAPLEQRRLAVAEALDCCSHRLDAWLTSLATTRLRGVRATDPSGLTLGAYGWVDDLPGPGAPRPPRGGYIHAPSLAQATTAGVLRSASLAHQGQAYDLDLSSGSIRTATWILDGVRAGQPLGAVLGYRVERALQEGGLARFVPTLRNLAPLAAGAQTGGGAPDGITRAGILDGVALLGVPRAQVHTALARRPDNPFLAGPWTVSTDETDDVDAVLDDAAAAYDAVADLLLAESVHQLVTGGTARAAATLDAAGAGALPPPEPEFTRTPTTGVPITHRDIVLLLAGAGDLPPAAGWVSRTPRASAEPRLERWLRARLGPAAGVPVAGAVTLDQLGVSASDLVYACGDDASLARLLTAAAPAGTAGTITATVTGGALAPPMRRLVQHARALRQLLAAARLLAPADLAASGSEPTHTVDVQDVRPRVEAAIAALATAANGDAAALVWFGIDPAGADVAKATARQRVEKARAATAAATPDWAAAAAAVFGDEFRLLPRMSPVNAAAGDPFVRRLGRVEAPRSRLARFLRDAASVRPSVARHTETLLHLDASPATAAAYRLSVGQFGGAAAGQPRTADATFWLSLEFGAGRPPPDAPATCVVVDVGDGLVLGAASGAPAAPVTGLVVDEWVEVVPRGGPAGQRLASGVAVHADAPDARPPQAILIAVSPDDAHTAADRLDATLSQTLDLAKLRATTLEFSAWLGRVLPAMLFASFSLRNERVLDLQALAERELDVPAPFVEDI